MHPILGYLDPVTGSALLQVLLAAAAAVGLGYQYIRRGFRSMMNRFAPAKSTEEESESTSV